MEKLNKVLRCSFDKISSYTCIGMKSILLDCSPIGDDIFIYQNLFETYLWVAICLQANSWCFFLIGNILPYFLPTIECMLLAYVGLPLLTVFLLSQPETKESQRRKYVLLIAALDGSLMGSLLSDNALSFWPPPMSLVALSIAIISLLCDKTFNDSPRLFFVSASFAPGVLCCFVYGHLADNLFDVRFLFWILILIIEAFVDLQVKISRLREKSTLSASDQALSVTLFTFGVYGLTNILSVQKSYDKLD